MCQISIQVAAKLSWCHCETLVTLGCYTLKKNIIELLVGPCFNFFQAKFSVHGILLLDPPDKRTNQVLTKPMSFCGIDSLLFIVLSCKIFIVGACTRCWLDVNWDVYAFPSFCTFCLPLSTGNLFYVVEKCGSVSSTMIHTCANKDNSFTDI